MIKNPFCEELHATKYRSRGEDFREAMQRVASPLSDNEPHYRAFRDVLLDMRFLPAGRIQAAIGSPRNVTPYNCLTGDTEFVTRDGIRTLRELAGQEVELVDGNGDYQTARINSFGSREVFEVVFRSGSKAYPVRATGNHRWILADGAEKTTDDLMAGDEVAHVRPAVTVPEDMNGLTDLTALGDYYDGVTHGLVFGDGAKAREGKFQLRLCGEKRELLRYMPAVASVTSPPSCAGDPFISFESDVDLKSFPSDPSPLYLLGFLRGWLAADGNVSGGGRSEITICTHDDGVEWLRKHGPSVGFFVIGWSELSRQTNYGKRSRPVYNVRIGRRGMKKLDFLRTAHAENFRPQKETWKVAEIVSCGIEETFCPRVYSTSSFVLNHGIHTGQCYVAPAFEDTLVDTTDPFLRELSIMDVAKYAARTMRMGGGIGYDFSTLRPRGDKIHKLDSYSSGPVSFMSIFDAVCLTISSSGHRRGAQMGVLRVDHPDIEEFINAKQNTDKLTGFNISIAITDEFMMAVQQNQDFALRFGGRIYRAVKARDLWQKIMRSTWDWAEPGVIFIDRVNEMNNLHYCETIAATNPCGEQPLPRDGACLLGSFNLVRYLVRNGSEWELDASLLVDDIPHVVRAMDNVVDVAEYPHESQKREALSKRRMGLGVTGVANALEAIGYRYGSPGFCQKLDSILQIITNKCYQASAELASEKECFPLYQPSMYLDGEFIKTLWPETLKLIEENGIRNSHLTSIAPTGTISLCADNVSSGIEPVFSYSYMRTVNMPDGGREVEVRDYGVEHLGVMGKIASDVSIEEHVRVLTTAQRRVDSAVSKTCNVPPDTPWEDFNNLYIDAWKGGAKGCTTFQVGGKRFGVLRAQEDGTREAAQCRIDSETGRRECE